MSEQSRDRYLRIALVIFGLTALALHPLMLLWPSGWRWIPNQPMYEHMMDGMYATMGVFLLLASRDPSGYRSFILFAAWSSFVHAAIMAAHSLQDPSQMGHMTGDVPALVIMGVVLLVLAPRDARAGVAAQSGG